jgi:hypothetical protein
MPFTLFSVKYGSENREKFIEDYLEKEFTISLILAAVHFEWTLKRTILVLGKKFTEPLGKELQKVYKFTGAIDSLEEIWKREIGHIHKSSFGKVIGLKSVYVKDKSCKKISNHAKDIRSEVIHGNRPPSKIRVTKAVSQYIQASRNLRNFVILNGKDLDKRLTPRKQHKK